MNDHTAGVLEGLGYCLSLVRKEKRSTIRPILVKRIIEVVEAAASDLEFRMRATF